MDTTFKCYPGFVLRYYTVKNQINNQVQLVLSWLGFVVYVAEKRRHANSRLLQ